MIVGPTVLMVSIGTGAHRLVEEDELLDLRPALAAVLLGPADAEPAVGAHALHDRAHGGADAVAVVQLLADLRRQELRVVRAEVAAQGFLFFAVADVHAELLGAMTDDDERPAVSRRRRSW
jgi:hypothetical protein